MTAAAPRKRLVRKRGRERWEVDFGMDAVGHRKRVLMETEAEANEMIAAHVKEQRRSGEWWARLSPVQRQQVAAVVAEMELQGKSVAAVWQEYQELIRRSAPAPTEKSVAYEVVVEAWRQRKLAAGVSERYVREAADVLLDFGRGRERQPIGEVLPDELDRWIESHRSWGLSSKRTQRGRFSSLWSVAVDKGWASYNIVDRLEPVRVPGPVVRIYANETVLGLFAAALEARLPVIVPLALGAFGCLRPEEIEKMRWEWIDLEHGRLTVPPEIAKTGDQRTVRLQPVAVEWLRLARGAGEVLPPVNERRLVDACCERIGLKEWIRDGLRKCCATHLRAVYKNDYDVVRDCGNSVRVLLKHYADLHTPEEVSLDYWRMGVERARGQVGARL